MRKTLVAVAAAFLLVPLAVAGPAEARPSDKVCDQSDGAMRYDKRMEIRKGGVLSPAKKYRYGALKGRWVKSVGNHDDNDGVLWKPYGPQRTRVIARNATFCVLVFDKKTDGMVLRKTDFRGLRKAATGKPGADLWGLRFDDKGKVVKAIQLWNV